MSTPEAVRCLLFPEGLPARELVLPIVDYSEEAARLALPEEFKANHVLVLMKDGLTLIMPSLRSTGPVNRYIPNHAVRGSFIIVRYDSNNDPVSLTDQEVAFYVAAAKTEDDTATPVDLGLDREVQVAHVKVTYQTIKIPISCPCGADLTRNDALTIWSYTDEGYRGRLPRHGGDEDGAYPQRGALITHPGTPPRFGEISIDNVAFFCASCSSPVAEGTLEESVS